MPKRKLPLSSLLQISTVVLLLLSCKNIEDDKTNTFQLKENRFLSINKPKVDLQGHLVKLEVHQIDKLGFQFGNLHLSRIENGFYRTEIEAQIDNGVGDLSDEYYLLVSLYPIDDEITLLKEERVKYGFESFSTSINSSLSQKLIIHASMHTKLNKLRAMTVSILDRNNQKYQVLVFQNLQLN